MEIMMMMLIICTNLNSCRIFTVAAGADEGSATKKLITIFG